MSTPDPPAPRRGEVWLARLDKLRPVVVLTRDPMSRYLHGVIGVPITHTHRGVSTEVQFTPEDGVNDLSYANLDNVQLLARELFVRRVGRARAKTMAGVCQALAIAVACDIP
jgi:mRNA interferase MazF